jgi:hypothetical protein
MNYLGTESDTLSPRFLEKENNMAKVVIGCRLPNGLTITHPTTKAKVTLAGTFSSKIIGATHATTLVEQEFWDTWKKAYSDYAPLKNGSIFEARSGTEAGEKAKDLEDEKTGFEPMARDAAGVKEATKD